MKLSRLAALLAGVLWLAGCSVTRPPAEVAAPTPPQWYAPLPHGGKMADLRQWWLQFSDSLLVELIDAAEAASPTVASAGARIAEARANRTRANASLLPTLDDTLSVSRGNTTPPLPTSTVLQNSLQASWEIDLFGGNRATLDASSARLAGSEAGWHDARVSVAAETATSYLDLRTCERLMVVTRNDASSRAETARLTQLSADAGFTAPAVAAQARASASEGSARNTQQIARCDVDVKALVALTGIEEPRLRARLQEAWREPAQFALPAVPSVPAALLEQRPDVYQAETAVAAASADVGSARAAQYPRLSLSGQLNAGFIRAGGDTASARTWSIGPLALSLPLFDAGRRAAGVDEAQGRYQEAVALYTAKVRQAVREVEEALVNLQSAAARNDDQRNAVAGYQASFIATESRYRSGLASLIELEDQRRTLLASQISLVGLEQERLAAWIALYRALGGGWQREQGVASQP
ncbi:efflux transporter outer membrane subunit [Ramlibacter sp. G-1-2-2]|uniref:Efflux transporter outer membrane subunit n=1 Tax=Ramlibacter agri TaxID=2728837 RepID=A0A848GZB7_9BURK|nr:efflux transporter outer membrane subunit [Ramlibacter agri]NML42731.1 efflux transporter outer membrane subunit [Ramlibacter agri]